MKEGESPRHTGAISIEGTNGISVTAENGGKIKISGHEKPPILNTDNRLNSDDGNLVPKPSSTRTDLYLRADGNWYTPADTQVKFTGKPKNNSNGKINTSNSLISSGNNDTQVVKSLVAGASITLEHDKTTGALTIIGPDSGRETLAGVGLTKSDTTTTRTLKLKTATYDTKNDMGLTVSGLGGIKVAMGGTKAFTYDWNSTNDAAPSITPSTDDVPVTVYQPNRANGKYYPVECTKDSAAVVCIPNVPSPFYDDTADENKFSIQLEDYNVISADGASAVYTGELSYNSEVIRNFISQVNNRIESEEFKINEANFQDAISNGTLQIASKKGLVITCPSNVVFAQLDCEMDAYGINVLTPIKSTRNAQGKQQISIKNTNFAAGFNVDSITTSTPGYAYLRFITETRKEGEVIISKGHTYNATIQITYENGTYKPDIII